MPKFVKIVDNRTGLVYPWMLEISSLSELADYDMEIQMPKKSQITERLMYDLTGTDKIDQDNKELYYYKQNIQATGNGIIHGVADISSKVFAGQMKCIFQYGKIFVKQGGGYMTSGSQIIVTDECVMPNFKFPDEILTEKDIRIKQFDGGKHYYAFVGKFEVSDDDGDKRWNTYDFAYQMSIKFLNKINNE